MKKIVQELISKSGTMLPMAFLFLLPLLTHAQSTTRTPGGSTTRTPGSSGELTNPLSVGTLDEFFKLILDVIVQIGWPLVVLAIIWTGFLFVKAQGKPAELDTAKQAFIWTVVGALVVLGAFAIGELVCGTVKEIGANVRC